MKAALCSSLLVAGVLLLGACGKSAPAPTPASKQAALPTAPTRTPDATPAKPALLPAGAASAPVMMPPPPPFGVASLTLGSAVNAEHQVIEVSDSFASTDKNLFASVATTGRTGGATLNAQWSYLEGKGQLVSSISQAIATDGPAVTTFKVNNPDLWPTGRYQVEISLDGKPVAQQPFQIKPR